MCLQGCASRDVYGCVATADACWALNLLSNCFNTVSSRAFGLCAANCCAPALAHAPALDCLSYYLLISTRQGDRTCTRFTIGGRILQAAPHLAGSIIHIPTCCQADRGMTERRAAILFRPAWDVQLICLRMKRPYPCQPQLQTGLAAYAKLLLLNRVRARLHLLLPEEALDG